MKVIALIPARYNSERFPGKLMEKLGDKSIIYCTYLAAVNTQLFDNVFVVTDSEIIQQELLANNANVIFSKTHHDCGSDRIAEAAEKIEADIIVNVQGDEPFIDKTSLEKLIAAFSDTKVDLASLKQRITDLQ